MQQKSEAEVQIEEIENFYNENSQECKFQAVHFRVKRDEENVNDQPPPDANPVIWKAGLAKQWDRAHQKPFLTRGGDRLLSNFLGAARRHFETLEEFIEKIKKETEDQVDNHERLMHDNYARVRKDREEQAHRLLKAMSKKQLGIARRSGNSITQDEKKFRKKLDELAQTIGMAQTFGSEGRGDVDGLKRELEELTEKSRRIAAPGGMEDGALTVKGLSQEKEENINEVLDINTKVLEHTIKRIKYVQKLLEYLR